MKTFANFREWTQQVLSNKSLKFRDQLQGQSLFDTNFNANQMASRRIERSLFIKLNSNSDELSNVYQYRYDHKGQGRIDPRYVQSEEQKKQSAHQRTYYVGEQ